MWLDSGKFIATPIVNSNLVCNRTAVLVFTTRFVLINISRCGCFKTHKTGLSFGGVGWSVLSKYKIILGLNMIKMRIKAKLLTRYHQQSDRNSTLYIFYTHTHGKPICRSGAGPPKSQFRSKSEYLTSRFVSVCNSLSKYIIR